MEDFLDNNVSNFVAPDNSIASASQFETAKFNANEAYKNRQFQADLFKNAIKYRMQDLKNSGINPVLAASSLGLSTGTPAGFAASLMNNQTASASQVRSQSESKVRSKSDSKVESLNEKKANKFDGLNFVGKMLVGIGLIASRFI